MTASPETDVLVIGGGPSGTTTASILAQQGHKVHILEREHFPRFHIGESLIPFTYHGLERTGMLEKMRKSCFVKKHSVQFVSQNGTLSEPFYFGDFDNHQRSQTWQVRRSEFDQMGLDNCREKGVKVTEGAHVTEVVFEGKRAVGARVKVDGGPESFIPAKVVVDASGQSTMILDRLNLREWDPDLKKAAVWTYWKGAYRDKGRDEGPTIVLQLKEKKGWFWYIPLHDDIISVGVVASPDYLFKERSTKDLEGVYFQEVARCPGLQPRLEGAEVCDIFRVQKEYSYKTKQIAGDGWVTVGDALGFLDPLYSSGVMLALTSGCMAADAIHDALVNNDPSEARLRSWETLYFKGMDRMRRLVMAFYDGLNFGKLVRRHPDKKGLITDILIGNLFKDEVDQLWPLIEELKEEQAQKASFAYN